MTARTATKAVVLGPQRHVPIVKPALESLVGPARTPIAFVSGGWEERESEDGEFRDHVQRPVLNLEIWGRVERIFARDPELLEAMRQRHDTLRRLQELYRLRLEGLLAAATALLRHDGDAALVEPEAASAIAMVRALDEEHQRRIATVHAEFDARVKPAHRDAVVQHKRELAQQMEHASALCLAGGHVGVLLHRLHLFDVLGLWGDRPIVAWSAGAMVLSTRIVLFHHGQHMGQGPSTSGPSGLGTVDTEVMEGGFGVLPGIVPLPHSKKRVDFKNRVGLRLFARRFDPDLCVLLDDGDRIDWDGRTWTPHKGCRRLDRSGEVREVTR